MDNHSLDRELIYYGGRGEALRDVRGRIRKVDMLAGAIEPRAEKRFSMGILETKPLLG